MERERLICAAKNSRINYQKYIVKDFSSLGEIGCWQIRGDKDCSGQIDGIACDCQKVVLPFICKRGSHIPVVTTIQQPPMPITCDANPVT